MGTLPKESYLDSLCADYSEPLHGAPNAYVTNYSGSHLDFTRIRIITSKLKAYDVYPNSTMCHAHHVGVTTIERLDQGHLYPLGGTNIKFAFTGNRTRVACVTGGHSTYGAIYTF